MLALPVLTEYIQFNLRGLMKKSIITVCIIFSALLILDSMNAGHALTMFLLAGIVPGTNMIVSANTMLSAIAALLGFIVARTSISFVKEYLTYQNEQRTVNDKV